MERIIRSRAVTKAASSIEGALGLYIDPNDNDAQTPALLFGKLAHAVLFNPIEAELLPRETLTKTGRKSTLLSVEDFMIAEQMCEKTRNALENVLGVDVGKSICEKEYTGEYSGFQYLIKPDCIAEVNDEKLLIEYKTVASHAEDYKRYSQRMLYDVQIAFYDKFQPCERWIFVFQEKIEPYSVRVCECSLEYKSIAVERMERYLSKLVTAICVGAAPTLETI